MLAFLGANDDYEPDAPMRRAFAGGRKQRVGDDELTALLRALDAPRGEGRGRAQLTAARAWAADRSLDAEGAEEFEQILGRYLGAPPERSHGERVGLEFTLRKTWNVVPAPPEPISEAVRVALARHFAEDAATLSAATGLTVSWSSAG